MKKWRINQSFRWYNLLFIAKQSAVSFSQNSPNSQFSLSPSFKSRATPPPRVEMVKKKKMMGRMGSRRGGRSLSNWRDYTCFRPGCVKGHASWDKGRRTTGASINFNFEQTRKEANPGCIFDTPQHGVKPRGGRYPAGAADKWPARLDLLRIRASNHVPSIATAYRIHFLAVSHEETGYLAP